MFPRACLLSLTCACRLNSREFLRGKVVPRHEECSFLQLSSFRAVTSIANTEGGVAEETRESKTDVEKTVSRATSEV